MIRGPRSIVHWFVIVLLHFVTIHLHAQPRTLKKVGTTRAVVVGISDYKDPLIPDLKYADRDAEAFTKWLRAPGGYALPDTCIRFLTNNEATTAQMIIALDWLIEASQPGDQAFIYFSGHGDVERVTKFNLGYLLSYDSPPTVYGAGAFSLQYLQAILSTLAENEVQVFMITDACRSGKLAGSEVNGTQVTATRLAQQFANEIKILSCQPDEYSLEGIQWGGGRGCFSYHLEDALYGFADADHSGTVDLYELRRYLEEKVTTEAAPQSQMPLVSGSMKIKIANVKESELAARKASKEKSSVLFAAIDDRGSERLQLAGMDTTVQRLYAQFLAAVESCYLMSPVGTSANDYFNRLVEKQEMEPMYGSMKRKLAAALMDEGQTIINKVMQTDPQMLDNIWAKKINYDHLPSYFHRAAEILGPSHYVYRDLKARELYFKALTIRPENYPDSSAEWIDLEKRKLLNKALIHDSTLVIIYEALGNTYPRKSDERLGYYLLAAEMAPGWALIYSLLGRNSKDPIAGLEYNLKAMELDSSFLFPYFDIALRYAQLNKIDSSFITRQQYVDRFFNKFNNDPSSITAYECNGVGNALWRLGDFESAKKILLIGEALSNKKWVSIYMNLSTVLTDMFEFDSSIQALEKVVEFDGFEDWYNSMGKIYFNFLYDNQRAIDSFNKGKQDNDPDEDISTIQSWYILDVQCAYKLAKLKALYRSPISFYAGESAVMLGMPDTAAYYFKLVIDSFKMKFVPKYFLLPNYLFTALAYDRLGSTPEAEQIMNKAKVALGEDPWLYFNLSRFYASTRKPEMAIESLYKAIELGWKPNPLQWVQGTLCDHLLNPIRETDAYKQLVKTHFPKYYDIATRVPVK